MTRFPCFGSSHPNGLPEVLCEMPRCHAPATALVWMRLAPDFSRDVHLRLCVTCTIAARANAASVLALATARDQERTDWLADRHAGTAAGSRGDRKARTKAGVARVLAGERFSS